MIDQTQIPKDWREWWTERAAIQQYDGALSQAEAEDAALACLRAHLAAFRERQRSSGAGRVS